MFINWMGMGKKKKKKKRKHKEFPANIGEDIPWRN